MLADPRPKTPEAVLGFGCASLYGLPTKRDRRKVVESAYDFGFRHFDVAPIYGFGLAEAELAEFIGNRADVTVATKFGLQLTRAGRLAGRVQMPIRRVLRLSPSLKAKAQNGSHRGSGGSDRILYSSGDYSVAYARQALRASLRALRVDRIDHFLLHEPACAATHDCGRLIEYLETERSAGLIGNWGPAGDLSHMDADLTRLSGDASVHQFPYDLAGGRYGPVPENGRTTITYGFISTGLPRVTALLTQVPSLRQECSELLDADLSDRRVVVRLLVRDALAHNTFGTVLVSSTKIGNLRMLREAANTPFRNEAVVSSLVRRNLVQEVVT